MLLLQQSRLDMATDQLRLGLAENPDDALAHALLAICLADRKQYDEATREAQQAIHCGPDHAFPHYALAKVYYTRDRYAEALAALDEALALDRTESTYFRLLASIHLAKQDWPAALAASEEGLAANPEDEGCLNLRAVALTHLGRQQEARASVQASLKRAPDNAFAHAAQGWSLLHEGQHQQALVSFQEALRLDPNLEYARSGIIEALKARHLIYRWMLAYYLWTARLSGRLQWALILGLMLGSRLVRGLAQADPNLAPVAALVGVGYFAFMYLTWTASPLFNLLLRLNRFGRLALRRDETVCSNWVGLCLLGAVISLIAAFLLEPYLILMPIVLGLLVIPISATFVCPRGWPRNVMGGATVGLAAVGLGACTLLAVQGRAQAAAGNVEPDPAVLGLASAFLIGLFVVSLATNVMARITVKK